MDTLLEKEISGLAIKAAGLTHRCQSVLVIADLLNEYVQLTNAQQKLITTMYVKLNQYEEKSADPIDKPVSGKTSPPA